MIAASLRIRIIEKPPGKYSITHALTSARFSREPTEGEYEAMIWALSDAAWGLKRGEKQLKRHLKGYCKPGVTLRPADPPDDGGAS